MSEPRILCAVRGGPQSRHTVDRAVELAQERGAHLVFLYIAKTGIEVVVAETPAASSEGSTGS